MKPRRPPAPRRDLVPIDEIVARLAARVPELVAALGLKGYRAAGEFVACNPTRADHTPGSFSINLRTGVWADFAGEAEGRGARDAGDALKLIAYCQFGGDLGQAVRWAKGWLGLDGTDPAALKETRRALEARAADPGPDEAAERKRAFACRIWLSARELAGTPAAAYLAGRGLDVGRLDFPVGVLRFHPALRHPETKREHPAMVAQIVNAAGRPIAVHRTWLEADGAGGWTKLRGVADAKMTLGPSRGGFIPLWKGVRVDPATGEILKNQPLARCRTPVTVDMTEGIEDGLSVVLADPSLRVLVGVALSKMASIRLPPIVERVVLWRQNDPPGSAAEAQFLRTVEAFQRQGKRVAQAVPPDGVKDANDVVRSAAGETAAGGTRR